MRRIPFFITVVLLAGLGNGFPLGPRDAEAQLWKQFAHAATPHVDDRDKPAQWPHLPMSLPLLHASETAVDTVHVLVVLLEFDDLTALPVNTPQRYADMIFNGGVDGLPSVADLYRENSNGRLLVLPAAQGDNHGPADGVVGWVSPPTESGCCRNGNNDPVALDQNACLAQGFSWSAGTNSYYGCWIEEKRAQGIVQADPFFDFGLYDRNGDQVITAQELTVIVINAAGMGYGGNNRLTSPMYVDVESQQYQVFQWVTGITEATDFSLVAHEMAHQSLGHGDLYERCSPLTQNGDTYHCGDPSQWSWPTAGPYTLMYRNPFDEVSHLDPWAKVHLGFVKPQVVTHDGIYTLYDVETDRSFAAQTTQPEALIVYDPLRPNPHREYFILENRTQVDPNLDRGLAVWSIDENGSNWPNALDFRRVVRLIRRDGHFGSNAEALWDGSDATDGYDLTATSTPRNTHWQDGSVSDIEIHDISAAGPIMTFRVQMTPIYVDRNTAGFEVGTRAQPWDTLAEGVAAIPEPPRTIRLAGGTYAETPILSAPLTLRGWKNGSAVIGQ